VPLELAVQRGTEATTIRPPLLHRFHDHFGVRAGLAAMSRLVVLVESIRAPEALVTAVARVFTRAVVELLLVSLPIELALEGLVTRRTPKLGIGRGIGRRGNGTAHRRRRETAVVARAARYRGYGRSTLGRGLERSIHVIIKVLYCGGCFGAVSAGCHRTSAMGNVLTIRRYMLLMLLLGVLFQQSQQISSTQPGLLQGLEVLSCLR